MRRLVQLFIAALPILATAATCPPDGQSTASLQAQRAGGWSMPQPDRQPFALALADCLGDPDPVLRDSIAFEGLQALLRKKQLDMPAVQALRERLLADLDAPDPLGFGRPFAILALAEVARVDRIDPFLADAQRAGLVETAARFLSGVRDYRGFEEGGGWRHGVAHGADLVMQLALNRAVTPAQGGALLDAVLAQAMPQDHAYVFGEPGRLAAAAYYLAARGWWDAAFWRARLQAKLAQLGRPETVAALRNRHNLEAFTNQLAVNVLMVGPPAVKDTLLPALGDALKAFD